MIEQTGSDSTIVITLVGGIISLVSVIVWCIRSAVIKFLGRDGDGSTWGREGGAWGSFLSRFDRLEAKLDENTQAVRRLEESLSKAPTCPVLSRSNNGK